MWILCLRLGVRGLDRGRGRLRYTSSLIPLFYVRADDEMQVVKSLITRDAPGLVHLMLTASFQKTPYAAVSRPAAGIYKDRVLMITLPGGSKAVRENIEALVGSEVLQRCVRYMEGGRHVKDVQK